MVPRVRSRTIHTHSTPTIPVYRLFITPTAIGSSRPTSTHPHNSTRATMVMALTSQGFARAPTATRSALAPRGTWTLDAMTMAFVRSESVDGKRWTRGDDDDDARPTDARPRRDAGAIRDGDTRSGRPGDEDAFVARAMMGRARRAREETRCIFMCTSTTVDRAGAARRARSTGRDADDEWMSERTIERPTDRWGDREVEGVSSIVES